MGKITGEAAGGDSRCDAPELRFECTSCGACCRRRGPYAFVYINDREIDTLAAYLRVTRRSFLRRHTFLDELGWRQLRFSDAHCPFLDDATGRCGVYAARPAQCRTFPFWREFVEEGGWSDEVRELCEGIGRGPVWDLEQAETAMCEMDAWEDE